MTNEEIRYQNLLALIDQYGLKFLADGLGHKSTSALCQLKNKSEDSKTKNEGSREHNCPPARSRLQ